MSKTKNIQLIGDMGAVKHNTEQTLTDEQKLQARTNIGVEYTDSDALEVLAATGTVYPIAESDDSVLTDENGKIILL